MDSLRKLKSRIEKQIANPSWDADVNANMSVSDIKHWCNEFLRLDKNIEETSISPSHKIERKQKLINDLLNR